MASPLRSGIELNPPKYGHLSPLPAVSPVVGNSFQTTLFLSVGSKDVGTSLFSNFHRQSFLFPNAFEFHFLELIVFSILAVG